MWSFACSYSDDYYKLFQVCTAFDFQHQSVGHNIVSPVIAHVIANHFQLMTERTKTWLDFSSNWWSFVERVGVGGGRGGVKSLESQVFKVDLNPPSSSSTCWVITVHSIRGELSWIWLTNDLDLASRGICFSTCVRGDITYKVDHFWMFHISTAVVGVQRQQGLVGWPVHGQRHWPTLTT